MQARSSSIYNDGDGRSIAFLHLAGHTFPDPKELERMMGGMMERSKQLENLTYDDDAASKETTASKLHEMARMQEQMDLQVQNDSISMMEKVGKDGKSGKDGKGGKKGGGIRRVARPSVVAGLNNFKMMSKSNMMMKE